MRLATANLVDQGVHRWARCIIWLRNHSNCLTSSLCRKLSIICKRWHHVKVNCKYHRLTLRKHFSHMHQQRAVMPGGKAVAAVPALSIRLPTTDKGQCATIWPGR